MVTLKSAREIETMARAGRVVAGTLRLARERIQPGMTTEELDQLAEEFIRSHEGATPSFKGLYDFPATLCTSINNEVVHGIPSARRVLREGDLLSVDVGVWLDGLHADAAATFPVGRVSAEAERLLKVTQEALAAGIAQARAGNHVGDIGNICAGASFHYGAATGMRMKERLQQLNEVVAGNRFLRDLLVPGGVRLDLSDDLVGVVTTTLSDTRAALESLMERIEANPSIVDRLDDTGILSNQAAVDLAVAGVAARASGVNRDARRDHPHGAFAGGEPSDLRVVTTSEGDVMARVTIRALEARESIRLVGEFVRRLEPGPLQSPLPEPLPGGLIGIAAIYLRHKHVPDDIQPATGTTIMLWIATIVMGGFAGYYVVAQLR